MGVMFLFFLIGLSCVSHGLVCPAEVVMELLMLTCFCISGKAKRRDIECNNNSEYIFSYSSTVYMHVSVYLICVLDDACNRRMLILLMHDLILLFSSHFSNTLAYSLFLISLVLLFCTHCIYYIFTHPFFQVFQHLSSNFTGSVRFIPLIHLVFCQSFTSTYLHIC